MAYRHLKKKKKQSGVGGDFIVTFFPQKQQKINPLLKKKKKKRQERKREISLTLLKTLTKYLWIKVFLSFFHRLSQNVTGQIMFFLKQWSPSPKAQFQ